MLEKDIDEIVNDVEVMMALQQADHFYITHYCKKREQIESRRCYWDSKSKIYKTKKASLQ